MATRQDIVKTTESKVRGGDAAGMVINLASLHTAGLALPLGGIATEIPRVPQSTGGEIESSGLAGALNQSPVTLRRESDGQAYTFPTDPTMTVNGKNIITRRYVAKGSVRGSVKEFWSQDDYEIGIGGVLVGDSAEELNAMVRELLAMCEAGETLLIENEWLTDSYGITRIVVESCNFPHTKGLSSQAYTMKCYSDQSVKILEEAK